jgi:Sec-independent protein translocase protein TatA
MLAIFSNLSFTEVALIALMGILVFGRKLPRIAVEVATQVTKMRRSLNKVWRETGVQDEIRRMQREIRDAEYEVRDAVRRAADAEEAAEEAATAGEGDDIQDTGFEGEEHDAQYHGADAAEAPSEDEGPHDENTAELPDEPEAEAARRAELHTDPEPNQEPRAERNDAD